MAANMQPEAEVLLLGNAKLTLSPFEVRTDKALGTSRAVFCFFTMWMKPSGMTTCRADGKTGQVKGHVVKRWRRRVNRSVLKLNLPSFP